MKSWKESYDDVKEGMSLIEFASHVFKGIIFGMALGIVALWLF